MSGGLQPTSIALVVHRFPPKSIGGTEVYVERLAHALSRHHKVSVFYRDNDESDTFTEERACRDGIRLWRVRRAFRPRQANPAALFRDTFQNADIEASFERFLDETKPDLVHFNHLMSLSYRLIAQAKRRQLPCVLTLHDYWFICPNSQLIRPNGNVCAGKAMGFNCARCAVGRFAKRWLNLTLPATAIAFQIRDRLVRQAALHADLLIAPSHFLLQRYLKEGFPVERLLYLENGVDISQIRRHTVRRPPSGDRLRVSYLGALAWQKGVHILVEAFRDLPPERATLRVYGDLSLFPEYSRQLRHLANKANTSFMGPVPHGQVGQVLGQTDILAVPSLWYENSPVVIQEAWAVGVPVIASAHGALVEKVQDGVSGLLVPPGDVAAWRSAIQQLTTDVGIIERLRSGVPCPMSMEVHMNHLEAIYAKLLAGEGTL